MHTPFAFLYRVSLPFQFQTSPTHVIFDTVKDTENIFPTKKIKSVGGLFKNHPKNLINIWKHTVHYFSPFCPTFHYSQNS